MKFNIRIFQKGGFPQNFPYLFKLDKEGYPISLIALTAKDKDELINNLASLDYCKKNNILENVFFERYILKEVK